MRFKVGLVCLKTAKKTQVNSLKQLTTANSNRPWSYKLEGLLSEGSFRLRFRELIFRRAYYLFIYLFFWGGGRGYRNFKV